MASLELSSGRSGSAGEGTGGLVRIVPRRLWGLLARSMTAGEAVVPEMELWMGLLRGSDCEWRGWSQMCDVVAVIKSMPSPDFEAASKVSRGQTWIGWARRIDATRGEAAIIQLNHDQKYTKRREQERESEKAQTRISSSRAVNVCARHRSLVDNKVHEEGAHRDSLRGVRLNPHRSAVPLPPAVDEKGGGGASVMLERGLVRDVKKRRLSFDELQVVAAARRVGPPVVGCGFVQCGFVLCLLALCLFLSMSLRRGRQTGRTELRKGGRARLSVCDEPSCSLGRGGQGSHRVSGRISQYQAARRPSSHSGEPTTQPTRSHHLQHVNRKPPTKTTRRVVCLRM